ncbi:MAG TPA: aminopeptidase [Bacteroidales bacterium]|nr:MAG: aminopeptidase [Bacteroidetes bacterium GWF2_33_38]OFY74505.1 MAG: aminopeptidase [Bacteroidetes bacterium RIFOXYA12_FULL_33_9]OFY88862.1 MAG: aminopeptidase [Bacteroidetes bacterium RIFOXYA2_FULL_33_7]HBF87954.1 aminopeptidase [Bacteroidales bacterium]
MELLKELCGIHAPSGEEYKLKEFILEYVQNHKLNWKVQPTVVDDNDIQDCILLVFGKPHTAIFVHMDSVGFTVRYNNELIKIGSPDAKNNDTLVGKDSHGKIECKLNIEHNSGSMKCNFSRTIDVGTSLTFKNKFKSTGKYIESCSLDNRLGIRNALAIAETMESGIIAFTCWEEHGGGSVSILSKIIYENFNIQKAIILDTTWVSEGVKHDGGAVISIRDQYIPRRKFINEVIYLAKNSNIPYQLEVEDSGGSDGSEIQKSPYPIDWCFIGIPTTNPHSANEIASKKDIESNEKLCKYLMENL